MRRPLLFLVPATLALAGLAGAAPASTPASHTVAVPAVGESVTVTWTGVIPPGSAAAGSTGGAAEDLTAPDCRLLGAPPGAIDHHTVHLAVPAGAYDVADSAFEFSIEWKPTSPDATTSDEILHVIGPGGDVGSSDGGTPRESVGARNLPAGDYDVMACGFLNAANQPYTGKLTVRSVSAGEPLTLAAPGAKVPLFGSPVVNGIQGLGDEQTLRIDTHGRMYASGIDSLSSTVSFVWRSLDGGKTWKWIPNAAPITGKLQTCIGGGDSELATDSGDHLYLNDLELVNFATARSDDQGRTFTPPNCTAVASTPDDREWYAVDGDPTKGGSIYLGFNIVLGQVPSSSCPEPGNQLVLARSPVDPTTAPATAGVFFGPVNRISAPCDEGIMGNIEVSPRTHHVLIPHDNADFDALLLGVCTNVPFTQDPSGLSCVDRPAVKFPGFTTGASFPTLGVDRAGNAYLLWEQAPVDRPRHQTGDLVLKMAVSTDEGLHWSAPYDVPTPGLHENAFAWIVAGDAGRVAVAWYGTTAKQNPAVGTGADATNGLWSLYVNETLNALDPQPKWTGVVDAGGHHIHKGSLATVIGGLSGSRALGDFFTPRVGLDGELVIAYGDTNNADAAFLPYGTVVRQIGGPSLYASKGDVHGEAAAATSVTDPSGDATFDALGQTSANNPNLDILRSQVTQPSPDIYRFSMTVADLSSLAPATPQAGTNLVWQTQFKVPSTTSNTGGHLFHVGMESNGGAAPIFRFGEGAAILNGGGLLTTYPGTIAVQGTYTATKPGTITIDVPAKSIEIDGATKGRLYEVTASTQATATPTAAVPVSQGIFTGPVGGVPPNLFDVAQSYVVAAGGAVAPAARPPAAVASPTGRSLPATGDTLTWAGVVGAAALGGALVTRRRRSRRAV